MSDGTKVDDAPKRQLRVTHRDEGDYMARGIKLRLDGRHLRPCVSARGEGRTRRITVLTAESTGLNFIRQHKL
jgi:hypothetical protein